MQSIHLWEEIYFVFEVLTDFWAFDVPGSEILPVYIYKNNILKFLFEAGACIHLDEAYSWT